jgi:phosphatidate cytidylyltransferase
MPTIMNNFLQRVLVALIGIPVMLGSAIAGGIWFFILVQIIAVGVLYEFYRLAEKKKTQPHYIIGLGGLTGILLFFGYEPVAGFFGGRYGDYDPVGFIGTVALFFILISIVYELYRHEGSSFLNIGTTMFGVLYVGVGMGTFIGLRELFGSGTIIILILVSIWVCDTAAYLGGKAIGKHKLYTAVSPNKTVEGAVFGLVFAVITSIACKYLFIETLMLGDALVIGLIVGVIGQVGDLAESMLKRDAGVKDSSAFFPGHGGFLDRFDSIMFVSPAVYLYILSG